MLERLKYHWLVLKNNFAGHSSNYMKGADLMSDYCFFCQHYYDKKCSGRYYPGLECRNFERLK
jgi:hypothetical protein